MRVVAWNGSVVSHSQNRFALLLDVLLDSIRFYSHAAASKVNHVSNVRPLYFPRISVREPIIRIFDLPTVSYSLFEHAVVISNTISEGYDNKKRSIIVP